MQNITLNNGVVMPQLGFGVWQVSDDEAHTAVTEALNAGYRSIDTARIYENEEGVGRAIADSDVPREELFITTKLWNTDHAHDDALRAFDASLSRLGLDYVDLYLMHWPVPSQDKYVEAWRAMEKIYADGRAKAIGTSNFTAETLTRLLKETETVPVLNQIELHPYLSQREMRAFDADHGIVTEAWSPLGQGKGLLDDSALKPIAEKHGASPAQVVLRWHLQSGNVVIPKSVTPSRIKENIDVFGFELDATDMGQIDALDKGERFGPDPATFDWMG
ncbi:aldo/keto reductase [Spirillospora sp. NPDC048911]|uniref:aldo/keto reductase n=1 Tax=Spirillospora sp. NPDC048911 TaxID=3364527 RepID=UPI00372175A3